MKLASCVFHTSPVVSHMARVTQFCNCLFAYLIRPPCPSKDAAQCLAQSRCSTDTCYVGSHYQGLQTTGMSLSLDLPHLLPARGHYS